MNPNDTVPLTPSAPSATSPATNIALTINLAAAPATPATPPAAPSPTPPPDSPPTARTQPPQVPPTTPAATAASPTPTPTSTPLAKQPAVPPALSFLTKWKKWLIAAAVVAVLVVAGLMAWQMLRPKGPGEGFVSGNGRIEATEIDIATKLSGRLEQLLVREGDFVTVGQPLARMQLDALHAQRDEAEASRQQAEHGVAAAEAQVTLREADHAAALALIAQRAAELDAAQRRLTRSQTLSKEGAASAQELDDDRAKVRGAEAVLNAARAQAAAAQAAVRAAKAQMVGARSNVKAATATEARVGTDIRDSELTAPRDGRIQFRVAQAGEVLGAGGRVLNLLDLSDVYMTFFVPETVAGRIALGSEVRIVLDAGLGTVVPASVSFVASQAQFTPKTVETASERTKLMFRVRAQIAPELLRRNLEQVKIGVPGVAWIKLDPNAAWPASLSAKVAK